MKVLMFGWEFPPHITGGLGTSCSGLTRGLSEQPNLDVLFVVPKAHGDENQKIVKIIGASDVPFISKKKHQFKHAKEPIDYYEVDSPIIPYITPEHFWELANKRESKKSKFIQTDELGRIPFSGKYGINLLDEVYKYSLVANKIAEENKFDIIHSHDWLTYPAGIAAKNQSNKPLVIHVHATEFDRSGGHINPLVYAIEREGMETADKIITVSNFTRKTVIEKYYIDPKKIHTVYNAVDPPPTQEQIYLKAFDEKLVTFLGRITIQKGPDYFIEAANLVLKKMNNVRFVMAGSGDQMNEMITKVARLNISDKFHFTGFLKNEEVIDLYRMSDIYVLPSISEPFGITPLEAMRSDVPVIVSKQSGISEILNHVIKVDFWDTNAMANAIYSILSYPALSNSLKKQGKKEVQRISWEKSATKVLEIYKELLSDYKTTTNINLSPHK